MANDESKQAQIKLRSCDMAYSVQQKFMADKTKTLKSCAIRVAVMQCNARF